MFKHDAFANSKKTRATHGRGAGLHKIKMNAKNTQAISNAPKGNHAMSARNFGIPQRFYFKEVDESSLMQLSNADNVESIDLAILKKEIKKQENILKRMSLEHALHYLFPTIAAHERKDYNKIINAVQSASPEGFQQIMQQSVLQRIKNVNVWLQNYVAHNGVQLCWDTPKFIYLPDGIPMPGKEDTHIVCPFFASKNFKTEPALNTGEEYLLATIDLEEAPFIKSNFSEVYVRNLAMTLQQRIENSPEKIRGTSLIFSGVPSENLLNWFRGSASSKEQKSTDQSPIPDVEVIYAIPSIQNRQPYLFTLKPSRSFFRLKKSNKINHHEIHKKMYKNLAKERVRMIIDEIILHAFVKEIVSNIIDKIVLQARNELSEAIKPQIYNRFIRFFWETFEKCLNPYQTLELPTIKDLERTPEALQADLRIRLSNPYVTITDDILLRGRTVAAQERKKGYYSLDWNHIINDSRGRKNYSKAEHQSIQNITNGLLNSNNHCGVFSRAPAILMIRNKSANNNMLMVCASSAYGWTERVGVLDNSKKTTSEPLVEYALFNIGLFYAQLSEVENEALDACCVAIIALCPANYQTRLHKFIKVMLEEVEDKKEDHFSFSTMISDMKSMLVSELVDLGKFKEFFKTLKDEMAISSNSMKSPISNNRFELENEVTQALFQVALLNQFSLNDIVSLLKGQHAKYISLPPENADFVKFDAIRNKLNPEAARKVLHIFDVRWETKNILKYIYVVMTDKTVRIALECLHTRKRPTHSELTNAEPILAGGELVFKKEGDIWKLITVNNGSGHYRPPPASLSVARQYIPPILSENGINCEEVLYCSGLKPDMAIGSNVDEILSSESLVEFEEVLIAEDFEQMPLKDSLIPAGSDVVKDTVPDITVDTNYFDRKLSASPTFWENIDTEKLESEGLPSSPKDMPQTLFNFKK